MTQQHDELPHKLVLSGRKELTMTGVTEMLSVDEDGVILQTALGDLLIQGLGMKLRTLSPEGGQVEVSGTVTAMSYQEPRTKGGWARRLFG